jgi:hypothetical protein
MVDPLAERGPHRVALGKLEKGEQPRQTSLREQLLGLDPQPGDAERLLQLEAQRMHLGPEVEALFELVQLLPALPVFRKTHAGIEGREQRPFG